MKHTKAWQSICTSSINISIITGLILLSAGINAHALDLPEIKTFEEKKTGQVIAIVNNTAKIGSPITTQSTKRRQYIDPKEKESLAIQASDKFLLESGKLLGVTNVASELYPESVTTDNLGNIKVKNVQRYKGVSVYGADIISVLNSSYEVLSTSGRVVRDINLDTNLKVQAATAIKIAKKDLEKRSGWKKTLSVEKRTSRKACRNISNPTLCINKRLKKFTKANGFYSIKSPILYVYNETFLNNQEGGENYLAWNFTIVNAEDISEAFFIDAKTGKILSAQETKHRDTYRKVLDCSEPIGVFVCYTAFGPGSNGYPTEYDPYVFGRLEGAPVRGPYPIPGIFQGHEDVDNGYELAGAVHNHYFNRFGRNGANNQGGLGNGGNVPLDHTRVLAYYNGTNPETCSPNGGAWWEPSRPELRFCLGDLDVDTFGHEYAHAVKHYTAGLIPQNESGALNESNSDIMGQLFEFYSTGTTDWQATNGLQNLVERDISNPGSATYLFGGQQVPYPDNYNSPTFLCSGADFGGVHINSTVPSHAAYLASEGGSHNGCNIQGVGKEKVEQIWYRALTTYFGSSTTFNQAYFGLTQACQDLVGNPTPQMLTLGISITVSDCENVTKALQSVEMDLAGGCNGNQPANYDLTPTCVTPPSGDFNGDEVIDLLDYQILRGRWEYPNAVAALLSAPPEGDANGDGVVNMEDYNIWRDQFLVEHPSDTPPPAPTLLGDYDFNGTIDTVDYQIWKNQLGMTAAGLLADGNVDGTVNHADLVMWSVSRPDQFGGDYDNNGVVDLWDYNALKQDWQQTGESPADVNNDNIVNQFDYILWADVYNLTAPAAPTLPGDCDGDGDVDGRDFLAWQRAINSSGPALACDHNADGTVNSIDQGLWQDNYGSSL